MKKKHFDKENHTTEKKTENNIRDMTLTLTCDDFILSSLKTGKKYLIYQSEIPLFLYPFY